MLHRAALISCLTAAVSAGFSSVNDLHVSSSLSVLLQLIKVYGEDSHSRSVWVSRAATARDVCHMLVQTAHCSDQENWALLELHPTLGLGETLLQWKT